MLTSREHHNHALKSEFCFRFHSVNDWDAVGCFNNFDHSALPEYFHTPVNLDVDELWPNLKPLAEACSDQAEIKNFSCFGIQYQHECWGGNDYSVTKLALC